MRTDRILEARPRMGHPPISTSSKDFEEKKALLTLEHQFEMERLVARQNHELAMTAALGPYFAGLGNGIAALVKNAQDNDVKLAEIAAKAK